MMADVWDTLHALADHQTARNALRFFKCGPGEYGEGDRFLGIRVPDIRKLAKTFAVLPLEDVTKLLHSEYHEARLLALILLVNRFKKADTGEQKTIYSLYLDNTACINNWDLVDTSAEHIVGAWLFKRDRTILHTLAQSDLLWERRIAVMATFHFIKQGMFDETLRIAKLLLEDTHDLIHKAVGWMLREVGKRDRRVEEAFLKEYYKRMPRTMLRYAIEKFPEEERQFFLKKDLR